MKKTYKKFLLRDIAILYNGNKFDKNKMKRNHPEINFVSRTAANNGISDFVDKIDNIDPYPAGDITLAFGGSIGSCFLQKQPFYTGQNVGVIHLPDYITDEAKLYFTCSLEELCKESFVAFSKEINRHFKTDLYVVLPSITPPEDQIGLCFQK